MIDINLARGEHRRLWLVDIRDAATGEHVALPPTAEWHDAIHAFNVLGGMYGISNVKLYQWDIACIWDEALEDVEKV